MKKYDYLYVDNVCLLLDKKDIATQMLRRHYHIMLHGGPSKITSIINLFSFMPILFVFFGLVSCLNFRSAFNYSYINVNRRLVYNFYSIALNTSLKVKVRCDQVDHGWLIDADSLMLCMDCEVK